MIKVKRRQQKANLVVTMLHNDLESLRIEFRPYAELIIAKAKKKGVLLVIEETLREEAVQAAYYAQGRQDLKTVNELRAAAGLYALSASENTHVITHRPHIYQNKGHGAGLAADYAPVRGDGHKWYSAPVEIWRAIGEAVREINNEHYKELKNIGASLEWGGDYKNLYDPGHVEMRLMQKGEDDE